MLHGGGNTSVKTRRLTALGRGGDVLYVKGSGGDLATIDERRASRRAGSTHLLGLAGLERAQRTSRWRASCGAATIDPARPAPSVEAILHALIPPASSTTPTPTP